MTSNSHDTPFKWRPLPPLLLAAGIAVTGLGTAQAQTAPVANPQSTAAGQGSQAEATDSQSDDQSNQDASQDDGSDATVTDPALADPDADPQAAEDAAIKQDLGRQNLPEISVDNLRRRSEDASQTPGIAMGAFTLRPTISGGMGVETTKTGSAKATRSYLTTGATGTLTSNWSSHELRVDTSGDWEKTLSGVKSDDPEGSIAAALRLDVSKDTIANLKAGYSLQREDLGDANAIDGAANQGEVSTWTANADITRDLGLIRGTLGADFERETYGEATLANGSTLDQADRNQNTATLRGRIGYELSSALIPFVETSYGRMIYDNHTDSSGYIRDAAIYSAETGVELDLGEKLRGEFSAGYTIADFEDARLKSLSGVTINGDATWSPRRGTDVEMGLKTEVEPSTSAGASGSIAYTINAGVTQAIIDNLNGRMTGSTTWRDYASAATANQMVYDMGVGLTWGLSRSIDLNGDLAWERSTQKGSGATDKMTATVGVSLKR